MRSDLGLRSAIESLAKVHRKMVALSVALIAICYVASFLGLKPDSIGGIALGAITLGAIMLSLISLVVKYGPLSRDCRRD